MIYQWLLFLSLFFLNPQKEGTLTINISNIESMQGELSVGLYNTEDSFCSEDVYFFARNYKISQKGQQSIALEGIPFGTYALALYQDLNINDKIDKTMLGIPKEPYAFSNNVRVKWSEPTYAEAKFEFTPDNSNLDVEIRYWKDY